MAGLCTCEQLRHTLPVLLGPRHSHVCTIQLHDAKALPLAAQLPARLRIVVLEVRIRRPPIPVEVKAAFTCKLPVVVRDPVGPVYTCRIS